MKNFNSHIAEGAASGSKKTSNAIRVYYFSDYLPTLTYEQIEDTISGDVDIFFDRRFIDKDGFEALVKSNYFSQFDDADRVVIDIKTFLPSAGLINAAFSRLKGKHIFVSIYQQSDFDGTFDSDIEFVCDLNLDRIRSFIYAIFPFDPEKPQLVAYPSPLLVDGRLLTDPLRNESPQSAIWSCLFLRCLALNFELPGITLTPGDAYSYSENPQYLYDALSYFFPQIYFHTRGYEFYDFFNGNDATLQPDGIGCGFGFLEFTDDFYQFMLGNQTNNPEFRVYAMTLYPVSDTGRLRVIADSGSTTKPYYHEAIDQLLHLLENR